MGSTAFRSVFPKFPSTYEGHRMTASFKLPHTMEVLLMRNPRAKVEATPSLFDRFHPTR